MYRAISIQLFFIQKIINCKICVYFVSVSNEHPVDRLMIQNTGSPYCAPALVMLKAH